MKKGKTSKIKENFIIIPNFLAVHLPKCEEINSLTNQISQNKSIDEQLSLIKSISLLNALDKYKALLIIYLICPYKHPAKKTIARILSTKETSDDKFANDLQNYLEIIIEHDKDLKYFRYAINTCFDNFPLGVQAVQNSLDNILKIIPNHLAYFNSIISENNSNKIYIADEIHDYSRAVICIISLCTTQNIQLPKLIFDAIQLIIKNISVSMDTKCNFGMIIVQYAKQYNVNGMKEIISKLLNIKLNHEELWPKMDLTTVSEKICIISGILNTCGTVELYQTINDSDPLLISLGKYLFEIADTSCALLNTNELLIVCRGIVLISKKCNKIMEHKYLTFLQMFIKFVLIHLEHYCDTIRHNSKVIMINLVKNAVQIQQNGDCSSILNELIKSVFEMSSNNESGLYSCLSILCTEAGCNVLLKYDSNLTHKIMTDVYTHSNYAHQIRATYISLMTKHSTEVEIDVWKKLWIEPLINKIVQQNIHVDDDNLSLLQEAISINPQLSIEIIDTYKNDCTNPALFLICAKIARKFGISNSNPTGVKWKGTIDVDLLENAFSHTSSTIRLSAIAIIADSRKTTEIFTEIDFQLIKSFLKINLNCTEPSVRQDILAYYKKIFTRIKDSYLLLKRKFNELDRKLSVVNRNDPIVEESISKTLITLQLETDKTLQLIRMYEQFNDDVRELLLTDHLNVGVNYYRRNTTLEMYTLLKSILDEILPHKDWCAIQAINLIACLYDGYEQNKKLALNILIQIPLECILSSTTATLDDIIDICMKLATSKKPADCITAAYLLHFILHYPEVCDILKSRTNSDIDCPYYLAIRMLFIELQNEILVAKENIVTAAGTAPLYGCIFVIRYLHQEIIDKNLASNEVWIDIIKKVIDICFEISDVVLPIVNNQSPEGYLPDDFHETSLNSTFVVTPQMILLCSWRSVKEISLLFGDIVAYSKIIHDNTQKTGTITDDQVIKIGNYFISVLATTKHRGAFEQTYVGFSKLCKRLWSEKIGKLADLPRNWIQELLVDITNTTEVNINKKLCATRRSAGLPFMIQALESTALEVIGTVDLFKNCMETLLHISEKYRKEVNSEPCTHAMNILRALFRHNQLGEHCIQFISNGVIVALRGIEGKNWALRNAGTLLFSTLMTRIFGVLRNKNSETLSSRNRMTIHVFFSRFPHLFDFFLEELRIASLSDNNSTLKLSLYPILLLLARLYPSVFEESEPQSNQISSFLPYLNECCKNRIYKTRELAAKAIIPLLDKSNLCEYFAKLLNEIIVSDVSTNYCHGILLQMLYLLKSLPGHDNQLTKIWNDILKTEWILLSESYILKDVYNQILIELLTKSMINDEIKQFLLRAQQILIMPAFLNIHLGVDTYQLSNIKLIFHLQILYTADEIRTTLPQIFVSALTRHQTNQVISFTLDCLLFLLYENSYLFDGLEFNDDLTFLNQYKIKSIDLSDLLRRDPHFYDVFKYQLLSNTDDICRAKLFFLLNIYTGQIHQLFNLNEIDTLERFIDLCTIEYEYVCGFLLNCISELLVQIDENHLNVNTNVWNKLILCLYENASPEMPYKSRRTVAELIVRHPQLYTNTTQQNMHDYDLCLVWITIQLLGNDFEETIRHKITQIATTNSVHHPMFESVRDEIFKMGYQALFTKSMDICTVYLLTWITRCTSDDNYGENYDDDEMLVFNKGDMNLYIEDIHLTKISISTLQNIIFKQLVQKTPTQYIIDVLTNQDVIKWFPNESKAGRTILLNSITNLKTDNKCNTDIFKTDLLQYKVNLLLNVLKN